MLGYIKALVMNLATHNGNEPWTKMRKHIECNKSRETQFWSCFWFPRLLQLLWVWQLKRWFGMSLGGWWWQRESKFVEKWGAGFLELFWWFCGWMECSGWLECIIGEWSDSLHLSSWHTSLNCSTCLVLKSRTAVVRHMAKRKYPRLNNWKLLVYIMMGLRIGLNLINWCIWVVQLEVHTLIFPTTYYLGQSKLGERH